VEVEPFYLGKFEVTWPEYEAFAENYHRIAALDPEEARRGPRPRRRPTR
jgi:formylglycine-generating enzyme required for sulfatase activity